MPTYWLDDRTSCTPECQHVAPHDGYGHETMLMEDDGRIHTDDCGFWLYGAQADDPERCCTSGLPGVRCRVKSKPRASPAAAHGMETDE